MAVLGLQDYLRANAENTLVGAVGIKEVFFGGDAAAKACFAEVLFNEEVAERVALEEREGGAGFRGG